MILRRWSKRVLALVNVGGEMWLLRRAPGGWCWWEPMSHIASWSDKIYTGRGPTARYENAEAAWAGMRQWAAEQGTRPFEFDQLEGGQERAIRPARDALVFGPYTQIAPGPWYGSITKCRSGSRYLMRTKPWADLKDSQHRVIAKINTSLFDSIMTLRLFNAAPELYRFLQGLAQTDNEIGRAAATLLQACGLSVKKEIPWRKKTNT